MANDRQIENYPSTGEAVTVLVLIAAMFTVIGIFIGWLVFSPPSPDFSGRGSMTPWDRTALASTKSWATGSDRPGKGD